MENASIYAGLIATTPEEALQLLDLTEKMMNGEKEETNLNGYIVVDDTTGTVLEDDVFATFDDAVSSASTALKFGEYCIDEDCVAIYGLTPVKTIELVKESKIIVSDMG